MTKATRILWTSLGRMHRALFWVHQILLWKQWWGIHLGGVGSWKQQKPPTPQKVNPVCQLTYKNGYTLTYTEVLFWSVSFLSKKATLSFQRFTNSIQVRSWTFYIRQLNSEASQDLFFCEWWAKICKMAPTIGLNKNSWEFSKWTKSALPLKQPQNRISEATEFYVYELFGRQTFNKKRAQFTVLNRILTKLITWLERNFEGIHQKNISLTPIR